MQHLYAHASLSLSWQSLRARSFIASALFLQTFLQGLSQLPSASERTSAMLMASLHMVHSFLNVPSGCFLTKPDQSPLGTLPMTTPHSKIFPPPVFSVCSAVVQPSVLIVVQSFSQRQVHNFCLGGSGCWGSGPKSHSQIDLTQSTTVVTTPLSSFDGSFCCSCFCGLCAACGASSVFGFCSSFGSFCSLSFFCSVFIGSCATVEHAKWFACSA